MGKHRSRLKILANILSVVGMGTGTKKTQIMYQAYLSYKLLVQYLNAVIDAGLVTNKNGTTYSLTSKGELFLARFDAYTKSCDSVDEYLNHIEDQRLMLYAMCSNGEVENTPIERMKKI